MFAGKLKGIFIKLNVVQFNEYRVVAAKFDFAKNVKIVSIFSDARAA